jgi:hypothetical protein
MTKRTRTITRVALFIVLLTLASMPARADDKSFSTVVKHIKSNYKAKQQSFFGMMMFARLAVKVVKPAGVKNFKIALLRDLNYGEGPRPNSPEFHAFIRSQIDSVWSPLIQYSSPREKQWTYVYALHEKDDVKVLVVAMQEHDAFVLQTKFSPEKLIEFMNDPKIMGVALKHEDGPRDHSTAREDGDREDDDDEDRPPVKTDDKLPIKPDDKPPAKSKPPEIKFDDLLLLSRIGVW